ncbi:two-component system response regulator [Fischerella thermalis CCMEE 5205]|uniref:Protein PatA n=1 Tax=Fischerella thermalis CCMEE 5318 TaxID=2019666 RepID=A0A2N6LLZ4_9CYAN|nr:response regulator [Fischerella thermalis]PMB26117.1 two-component system response regulator [Fischerella thermalis CCMEE 5318]PMB42360.1 two-component system response regulator [Fischerella thermalis CCMEE 5205]
MSTSPISSYRFFQKLHPLSLLAQLTSRRATGCLRVYTDTNSWTIYLEEGKLTYASSSDKLFERLDHQLRRLSQQIPNLLGANRVQMRLMFDTKNDNQAMPHADYQAICWLVNQDYITPPQAAILIDELAKEVLESFLTLKQGSYEFYRETPLDELPKFCRLDLRLLVEHCQKQLRNKQEQYPAVNTEESSQTLLKTPSQRRVQPQAQPEQHITKDNHKIETSDNVLHSQIPLQSANRSLYTVACIDDSPTVLNSIRNFLDENTFSVVMINDPVKALMQILRSKPDLILLDVEMPNLDGYELCSLLRRHSAFKNTPIIMVTGRTGFIDRAKAKMVRSSGYLTKPFTQSDLLKMVFKHLD